MSIRLTSFLSAIESALKADESILQGGSWDTSRTVNYNLRLARFTLATRQGKVSRPLGTILLQAFDLADGSTCLRANLSWIGHDDAPESVFSIYQRPEMDWSSEAAQIASAWLAGPPVLAETTPLEIAEHAAASAETALAVAS